MSKIKIAEVNSDGLRQELGRDLTIVSKGNVSNIEPSANARLKMSVVSKDLSTEGPLFQEVSTIRLDPLTTDTDFRRIIRNSVKTGTSYLDHYISLPKLDAPTVETKTETSKVVALQDFETFFNYISDPYEETIPAIDELSLLPASSKPRKNQFTDFQNKNAPVPFKFVGVESLKNMVVPEDSEINSSFNLNNFPYYNKIRLTTKVNGDFIEFVKKINIFDDLLKGYLGTTKPLGTFNIQDGTVVNENVGVEIFDLLDWSISQDTSTFEDYFPLDPNAGEESKMIRDYKKILLAGYIRKISNGAFRSYDNVINGNEAHREDFVYSFNKYKQEPIEPRIQTFFLPSKDITVLNDTQIKYDQQYIYDCASHFVVVGNRYRYENLRFHSEDGQEFATVQVINEPTVVLIPVSMFQRRTTISQPPPMVPQIKFITENNSSNSLDVYLSSTKGEIEERFQPLFEEDQKQLIDLKLSSPLDTVAFKDFDSSGLYQIYKSRIAPRNYRDFSLKTEVRMPFETPDAIFKDKVVANEKMYYMFRKVNAKGLVSNPTPIYEVELVKDADDSKVVVNPYTFPEEVLKQNIRKFKNLFQITPAIEQAIFDNSQPFLTDLETLKGTIDNITLGVAEKSVWGRKFKFRFKSTLTGKIIDYNITFTLTKNKTNEDF